MISADIVNVVATATLGRSIDLTKMCKLKEITYNVGHYAGRVAYFKESGMQGRVSIFCSGKMISVGTRGEEQALCELQLTKEYLVRKKIIRPVILLESRIQNIVVVANFGKSIDLEKIVKMPKVIYEPEQFPGLILRLNNQHRATVLLFASGKAVITGLKDSQKIKTILQEISIMLNG